MLYKIKCCIIVVQIKRCVQMSYIKTKETGISKRRLKDGSWVFYGSYRDKRTSKVIRKKIGGVKEKLTGAFEAKVKFREMLKQEAPISAQSPKKITLQYISELYFKSRYTEVRDNFQSNFKDEETKIEDDSIYKEKKQAVKTEESRFKNHISREIISSLDIKRITLEDVTDFKDILMKKKSVPNPRLKIQKEPKELSTKTRHLIYALLKRVWNYGLEMNIIQTQNVLDNKRISKLLKNPKVIRKRTLALKEKNNLLSELKKLKEYNAFYSAQIALITGGRAKTILGIKKRDIDLHKCLITLNNYKTNKVYEIPFAEVYIEFFEDLFKNVKCKEDEYIIQPQRRKFYKHTPMRNIPYEFFQVCDRLFNSKYDKTKEHDRIKHIVNFHTLRHTRATELANSDVPLHFVKSFLNHSSLESTMIYIKSDTEKMRAQLDKLENTGFKYFDDTDRRIIDRLGKKLDKLKLEEDEEIPH